MTQPEFDALVESEGGLTGLYQSARARWDYSSALAKPFTSSPLVRGTWLARMIHSLQNLEDAQCVARDFSSAIQTRNLIAPLLAELGALIETIKATQQNA